MTLSRITLRLARNPGTEFPNGDDRHGYVLIAPLDGKSFIDEAEWTKHRDLCTILHFTPDFPAPRHGLLRRRGRNWFFDYEAQTTEDDEPVFKLGAHPFLVDEYVTVAEEDDRPLTYKVEEVTAPAWPFSPPSSSNWLIEPCGFVLAHHKGLFPWA